MDNRSFTDMAYRGYLIRINPLNGLMWIEKSGARICWTQSRQDALLTIDSLED